MVALGHRRIAYVHAPLAMNFAAQRHAGFLRGMAEAGIAVRPEYVVPGSLDRRGGYASGRQLLALPERPTAILVGSKPGLAISTSSSWIITPSAVGDRQMFPRHTKHTAMLPCSVITSP